MFDPDRIYVIDPYHLSVMSVCGCCIRKTQLTRSTAVNLECPLDDSALFTQTDTKVECSQRLHAYVDILIAQYLQTLDRNTRNSLFRDSHLVNT